MKVIPNKIISRKIPWMIFISLIFGAFLFGQWTMAEAHSQNSTWISIGPGGGPINSLVQDPSNGNILYLASDGNPCRIHKSTDKGNTWTEISSINSLILSLSIDPNNPLTLVAVCGTRFYKSDDGGSSWDVHYFSDYSFNGVMVDPNRSHIIHAFGRYRISNVNHTTYFKSTDGGLNWSNHRPDIMSDKSSPRCFTVDPTNGDFVYLAGDRYSGQTLSYRMYKTTDGGLNWEVITPGTGTESRVSDILIDPTSPANIYTANGSCIYRSSDGGSTWQKNNGWAEAYRLDLDPNNPQILYAGTTDLCFKSTNGGVNWLPNTNGLYGGASKELLVDRQMSNIVYFVNNANFFKSTDGGENWTTSSTGFIATEITDIEQLHSAPNILYAGTQNNGLFKTANAVGKPLTSLCDWEIISEFKGENISAMGYFSGNPDGLYAAMLYG